MVPASKKMNLHNHSVWSDGQLTIDALAGAALTYGVKVLAITDHVQTPKTRSVAYSRLPDYLEQLKTARDSYAAKGLRIVAGVELDGKVVRRRPTHLPFEVLNTFELILVEYVGEDATFGLDLETLVTLKRSLNVPVGLAHNDLALNFPSWQPQNLCQFLAREELFVELNSSYTRNWGTQPFYEHSEALFRHASAYDLKLSVGSDTHDYAHEVGNLEQPYSFLAKLGLLEQLIQFG